MRKRGTAACSYNVKVVDRMMVWKVSSIAWADPGFQVRGGAQFRWSKSASPTSWGWWEGGGMCWGIGISIL